MEEQVREVIADLRPMLQADGGDLELVEIEDGVVRVRLHGACCGCPAAATTLYEGVERMMRERIPGVVAVQAVP